MRRSALLLFVAMGCSFDASGFGEPPATTNATSSSTGPGATTGASSGGEPTTTGETGGTGSGSLSGSTGVGEVTTEPGTVTTGEATEGVGTSSSTTSTTEPGTTGCEPMDAFADEDGDGFGDPSKPKAVCTGEWDGVANNGDDCDDAVAEVNPDANELCDMIDNNCDGSVDEYDKATNNESCLGCTFRVNEDRLYYFCQASSNWDGARASCVGKKVDLVVDSSTKEHDWLVAQIEGLSGAGDLWWIGGREMSGFKWVDGTPVPADDRWAGGEPNDQSWPLDYGADCMVLVRSGPTWGKQWLDWKCGDPRRFICEGPLP